MPKISVKITSGNLTLEASGDAEAVEAQVERFLARVSYRGASLSRVRTVYDAITLVLYRAGGRALTRAEVEAALVAEDVRVKNVAQALADTKRHPKYITQAKQRGTWILTPLGHDHAHDLLSSKGEL